MSRLISRIADYIRETDRLLLAFCIAASLLGSIEILSVTNRLSTFRPFAVQLLSMFAGVGAAVFISMFDFESEKKDIISLVYSIIFSFLIIFIPLREILATYNALKN